MMNQHQEQSEAGYETNRCVILVLIANDIPQVQCELDTMLGLAFNASTPAQVINFLSINQIY